MSISKCKIPISGIGDTDPVMPLGMTNSRIRSLHSVAPTISLQLYVLKSICPAMPRIALDDVWGTHFQNIQLADPSFKIPGEIEVLLGADIVVAWY